MEWSGCSVGAACADATVAAVDYAMLSGAQSSCAAPSASPTSSSHLTCRTERPSLRTRLFFPPRPAAHSMLCAHVQMRVECDGACGSAGAAQDRAAVGRCAVGSADWWFAAAVPAAGKQSNPIPQSNVSRANARRDTPLRQRLLVAVNGRCGTSLWAPHCRSLHRRSSSRICRAMCDARQHVACSVQYGAYANAACRQQAA